MAAIWLYVILAVVADGLAGLAGGLLPETWLERNRPLLVGFAAGALLGAAFLDVLPEALEAAGRPTLAWTLGTVVAMAVFEWSIRGHRHRRGSRAAPILPLALLGSDALHNIADGAAIAASFLVSPRLGVITSVAIIVHEVPEEIGDYALLRAAGIDKKLALLSLAGVQLTALLGAVATMLAWSTFAKVSGIVLAIAAGTFIYIGASDLLPDVLEVRRDVQPRRSAMLGFLLGIAILSLQNA